MDAPGAPDGPWDRSEDPDRFDPARAIGHDQDRTLPELLGPGAQEERRAGLEWLGGLLAVVLFLALVAYLFAEVLEPA